MNQNEIEMQLIGCWLLGQHIDKVSDFEQSDFQVFPHVFEALREHGTDPLKIAKSYGEKISDIMKISTECFPSLFSSSYSELKKARCKRQIQELAINPTDIENRIEAIFEEMQNANLSEDEPARSIAIDLFEELDFRAKQNQILWGFPKLDSLTGGVRAKELSVIAARPGVGKTALALQVAEHISKNNKVLFISLEMSKAQLAERLICGNSAIPQTNLKNPKTMSDDDWKMLSVVADSIPQNLIVLEKSRSLHQIKAVIKKYQPDVIFIDQLSHVRAEGKTIRERYIEVTNGLKDLAMELGVAIVLLAQINRNAQERMPTIADLKESGSIEEDADNVFLIHRLSEVECNDTKVFAGRWQSLQSTNQTPIMLSVEKQRNGETKAIPMIYTGAKYKFREEN